MLLLSLSGAVPALVFMLLAEQYDLKRPEPRALLHRVAFWGGLATLPCIAVESALELGAPRGVAGALWDAFVVAALTEETAKALVLYAVVWRHPAFDERLDGIVYATRAGLGFALVENVGYLLSTQSFSGFVGVFILRAMLAVPGHAIYAGFMGYWAARRRFDGVGPGLPGGLAVAVLLHGLYDAPLFLVAQLGATQPVVALALLPVPVLVVVLGYWRLKQHVATAHALDDVAHQSHRPLPMGGGFVLAP